MTSDWTEMGEREDKCPIDGEQMVEVRWRHSDGTTTHRAGVFNWDMIRSYRILPNKPHAR